MRHRWAGRKLGRTSSHRKALFRTMVTEFFEHEKIITTVEKAKEVRSVAEKMITLGKKESLHSRRRALGFLRKKSVVFKLFDTLGPRFADRNGGYTRILRLGPRHGDGAEVALLEFVDAEGIAAEKKESAKPKAAKPKKAKPKKAKAVKEAGADEEKEVKAAGEKAKRPAPARRKRAASKSSEAAPKEAEEKD